MIALGTAATRYWRASLVAAFAAAPLLLGSAVRTEGNAANSPALKLITTIPINGTAGSPSTKLYSFDISFVDPTPIPGHPGGLYYLADRSNKALDVIDVATDTLFGQIGGSGAGQANFKGFAPCVPAAGANDCAGPDGVAAAFPCIFAGDGDSRLLSFNGNTSFTTVVSALNTGGTTRVDEMALNTNGAAATGQILAVNNAESPPFGTIFTYSKTTCALSNPIKVTFSTANGVNATNGAEQPAFDPVTGAFYVSLPEINGGTGITGAVVKISTAGVIQTVYPINYCSPAGLTVGPNGDLLVGCNTVFDKSGNKCTTVASTTNTNGTFTERLAACAATAVPQSAICNPSRGCTGNALVAVPGAGGGDEVWFNSGDGNYYVTAGNDPKSPVLGVISAATNTVTQVVPTLPPQAAVSGVAPTGTVHSVAASAFNNHVYVPLPANTAYRNCAQGCIAVFSAQ